MTTPVLLDAGVLSFTLGAERAAATWSVAVDVTPARGDSFTWTACALRVSKPPAVSPTIIKATEPTASPAASLTFAQCQALRVSRANSGNIVADDTDAAAMETLMIAPASAAEAVCTV